MFRYFNVSPSKESMFSRCQACNGANYIHLTVDDVKAIRANVSAASAAMNGVRAMPDGIYDDEEDNGDDEYGDFGEDEELIDEPPAGDFWLKREGGERGAQSLSVSGQL